MFIIMSTLVWTRSCCSCWYVLLQAAGEVQGYQGEYDNKGKYDFEGAVWRGDLITEGGGFCGARTKVCCPNRCPANPPCTMNHVLSCPAPCHVCWLTFAQFPKGLGPLLPGCYPSSDYDVLKSEADFTS